MCRNCLPISRDQVKAQPTNATFKGLVGHWIRGATGLVKFLAQKAGAPVDEAPDDVVLARRKICADCEHATDRRADRMDRPSKGLTTRSQCDVCKCYLVAKTSLASETCGLVQIGLPPKWGPVTPSPQSQTGT